MERAEAEAIYEQGREAVVAALLALSAQVAALQAQLEKQEERIAELERRLGRNSRNSSLPPSQDPPGAPPRPRQATSGRKRGAQQGHKGRGRRLEPSEAVDEIIDHWPEHCWCGHRFTEAERRPARAPLRHQVAELPRIAVTITEHRLHHLRCPHCGPSPGPRFPPMCPPGAFGPRLEAAVATLAVRNRVSRRDTVELVGELFGVRLCGRIDRCHPRARGAALRLPYEELLYHIRAAPAVNVDETGWRTERRQAHPVGRSHRADRRLSHRPRPPRARGQGPALRALRRHRLKRSLVGLQLPRPRAAPGLLGAPGSGLHRPQRGAGRAEGVRRGRP